LPNPSLPFPTPPPVSVPPPSASVTLFPVPTAASQPFGIVVGPDGNLWFTESNLDIVGRITPTGVLTEFHTPTAGSQPEGITLGPDGNIWFTESNANKVARITTAGVVTEFPVPTPYTGMLEGIAAGPDGALWFTEWNTNTVGRTTLDGNMTEYPAGTRTPGRIIKGPDGNLWFAGDPGSLYRITPSGVSSTVAAAARNYIFALTVDRAGNLWYTEADPYNQYGAHIARRDPAGHVTEFPVPVQGVEFSGIAQGPDGAIWFTESNLNAIGRLAMDGTITTYSAPSPMAIVAGPDGNMWFTSGTNGNAVGRVRIG
jgi:streptogramin lyase